MTTPSNSRGPQIPTVIWGALVIVAAVVLIAAQAGLSLDYQLVAIVALAATGATLLLAVLIGTFRRRP